MIGSFTNYKYWFLMSLRIRKFYSLKPNFWTNTQTHHLTLSAYYCMRYSKCYGRKLCGEYFNFHSKDLKHKTLARQNEVKKLTQNPKLNIFSFFSHSKCIVFQFECVIQYPTEVRIRILPFEKCETYSRKIVKHAIRVECANSKMENLNSK